MQMAYNNRPLIYPQNNYIVQYPQQNIVQQSNNNNAERCCVGVCATCFLTACIVGVVFIGIILFIFISFFKALSNID